MKKWYLMAALALVGVTASAQDDDDALPDGLVTVEWRFNPFDYESKPTNMAQLNARMFLDEKNAVRIGVGFGYNRDKDEQTRSKDTRSLDANNYDLGSGNTTTINKEMSLKVGLGYEYHFANTGRLDFYGGAEVGYLGRFYSATVESADNTTSVSNGGGTSYVSRSTEYDNFEYKKSNADRTKFNENGLYGTVFTGVDFYIYRKLYIGAELGVTFNTGKKANGTYTENAGYQSSYGSSETAHWTRDYSSETGMTVYTDHLNNYSNTTADYVRKNEGTVTKLYIEPAIRIGWMF